MVSGPSVFTAAFHRDFFLPLLFRSFGEKPPCERAGFEQHVPVAFPAIVGLAVLDIALVVI